MIEIIFIKKSVEELLNYVQVDFDTAPTEQESFLYKTFNGLIDGNYNFYDQAKELFLRRDTSPKKIRVGLEYPKDRSSLPTYVIREAAKYPGIANSIGKIENFGIGNTPNIRDCRQYVYEILCFTTNTYETILMAEVLYSLFLASYNVMSNYYYKIEFSQKDLLMENDMIPNPIIIRSINLELSSEEMVAPLVNQQLLGKVAFLDAGKAAARKKYGDPDI